MTSLVVWEIILENIDQDGEYIANVHEQTGAGRLATEHQSLPWKQLTSARETVPLPGKRCSDHVHSRWPIESVGGRARCVWWLYEISAR